MKGPAVRWYIIAAAYLLYRCSSCQKLLTKLRMKLVLGLSPRRRSSLAKTSLREPR